MLLDDLPEPEAALAQKKERERKQRLDEDMWNAVLTTVQGRYVINCILEEMARAFHMSFDPSNPHMTSFREGRRDVGNKIMERAFTNRSNLLTIMRDEHQARMKGDQNARTSTD